MLLAPLVHPAVYASVCPDTTGTAVCTHRNRAWTAVWLGKGASQALQLAIVSGAIGATVRRVVFRGRVSPRRGAESAIVAPYAFDLGRSVRGGAGLVDP